MPVKNKKEKDNQHESADISTEVCDDDETKDVEYYEDEQNMRYTECLFIVQLAFFTLNNK